MLVVPIEDEANAKAGELLKMFGLTVSRNIW